MDRTPPAVRCALPLLFLVALASPLRSQEGGVRTGAQAERPVLIPDVEVAEVRIDGRLLFPVRGIAAFPAGRRASEIENRIREVARDPSIRSSEVRRDTTPDGLRILVRDRPIVTLVDLDAELAGASLGQIATIYASRIESAIEDWREARRTSRLVVGAVVVVVGGLALVALLLLLGRVFRWLERWFDRRWAAKVEDLETRSIQIFRAERIRALLLGLVRLGLAVLGLVLVYLYLNAALGAFPWTRATAESLVGWLVDPVVAIARGILTSVPDLLFILVAWLFTRFLLRTIRAWFDAVERGAIALRGFEPEWAMPTYRLVRLFVVALFLVMIFPYIPGSSSDAFKGISLFLGIVFSLGSSSVIGNYIAGYTMTYRRAFRVGDRIRIGDDVGEVTETRLLVTHLRTPKNEEVIVPNTLILNGNVTNYSSLAREDGLILHTTVGIGYETPWRQVEAMLIEAARRTPGLEADPPPFVLERALGDFAVTYEINAFKRDAKEIPATYAALHKNILDVFNEYGVQIMTPAYEGDPEVPKVVPRGEWYAAPARPESGVEGSPGSPPPS